MRVARPALSVPAQPYGQGLRGAELRQRRLAAGLRVLDVAHMAGLTAQTVCAIERCNDVDTRRASRCAVWAVVTMSQAAA